MVYNANFIFTLEKIKKWFKEENSYISSRSDPELSLFVPKMKLNQGQYIWRINSTCVANIREICPIYALYSVLDIFRLLHALHNFKV